MNIILSETRITFKIYKFFLLGTLSFKMNIHDSRQCLILVNIIEGYTQITKTGLAFAHTSIIIQNNANPTLRAPNFHLCLTINCDTACQLFVRL